MEGTFKGSLNELEQKLKGIRLLVLDIDGVLTDGRLLYGENGEIGKSFNVKDGYGIRRLLDLNIHVATISARRSEGAAIRLSELGVEHIFLGVKNKVDQLSVLQKALGIDKNGTAVMGDDIPDLKMMELGALALTPSDGVRELRERADWITSRDGGHGAVREVCDAIANLHKASK
ncbi:MAG: KdsC family phosphatase [Gammaproteobacteria bacterium]